MKFKLTFLAIGLIVVECSLYVLLSCLDIDKNVIVICLTVLAALFGYFITHYLEMVRKQREKKYDLYLEFSRGLRLFLNEQSVRGNEKKHQDLVDKFQNIYFPLSVLCSAKVSAKLMKMISEFEKFLKDPNNLTSFRGAQKDLINAMRSEFDLEPIQFETFDIRVES